MITNHHESPGLTSCRNLSATFPWAALPAQKYLTTDKTLLCSNSTCHSHTTSVDGSLCLPPLYAHEWWPAKQNFKWAQVWFTLFLILMYISTIGRALSQVRPVSSQHFANLFLIVWFCLSTAHLTRARSCSEFSCQFPRTDPPALSHH